MREPKEFRLHRATLYYHQRSRERQVRIPLLIELSFQLSLVIH